MRICLGAVTVPLALLPEIAYAGSATAVNAMTKVRRDDSALPTITQVSLEAAQREFEAFQIVLRGPATGVTVKATNLIGPSGAIIPASGCDASGHASAGNVRIYREVFLQIGSTVGTGVPVSPPPLSDQNGAGGWVPDALIPQVDEFDNQCRWYASSLDVSSFSQNQVLWVEILVPPNATPGRYSGHILLAWTGASSCENADIAVSLKVWNFALPSTSSLSSFFGSSTFAALPSQHGVAAPSATMSALVARYAAMGLDHRIAMTNYDDGNTSNPTNYLNNFDPLNSGSSSLSRLGGAPKRVSFIGDKNSKASYDVWYNSFHLRPWWGAVFTYTVDEPGTGNGRWCDIGPLGGIAHGNTSSYLLPALVTSDITGLTNNAASPPVQSGCPSPTPSYEIRPSFAGDTADVNIMAPVIDALDRTDGVNMRSQYINFLGDTSGPAGQKINEVWAYESCDTHGCSSFASSPGISGTNPSVPNPLWPSIGAIDHALVRARAMPWMAFKNGLYGILYYDTLLSYAVFTDLGGASGGRPWTSQYLFGGNGDGTLFYPGTSGNIGVQGSDIPIASLRLKMIREGMEDYEYMTLLGSNRNSWVKSRIASVFANAWQTNGDVTALYNARHAMACQYLSDIGQPDPDCGSSPPNCNPPNSTACGSSCVNVSCDPNNCGSCGVVCSSGICNNGHCGGTCPSPNIPCCGGDVCIAPFQRCPICF